jgi:hypothetical protein
MNNGKDQRYFNPFLSLQLLIASLRIIHWLEVLFQLKRFSPFNKGVDAP